MNNIFLMLHGQEEKKHDVKSTLCFSGFSFFIHTFIGMHVLERSAFVQDNICSPQ